MSKNFGCAGLEIHRLHIRRPEFVTKSAADEENALRRAGARIKPLPLRPEPEPASRGLARPAVARRGRASHNLHLSADQILVDAGARPI